jgi:hypothetical protein
MSQKDTEQRSAAALAASPLGQRPARRSGRLCVALIAVCCFLVVVVARPPSSFGSTTPRCSQSNLILGFVRELGAAGTTGWDFALRNGGSATCHLQGYPGVGLLDGGARLIHVSVDRASAFKARNVVLHPWQRAYFSLTYHTGGCPLRLHPPLFLRLRSPDHFTKQHPATAVLPRPLRRLHPIFRASVGVPSAVDAEL